MNTLIAPLESEAQYLRLRQKLVAYFNYRRCPDPENMADETIARTIKSYPLDGSVPDVNRWAFGVARIVYLEWLRDPHRQMEPGAEDLGGEMPSASRQKYRQVAHDVINKLDADDRELLEERFLDRKRAKPLARARGISASGIRSRIHRLKRGLCREFASQMG